MRKLIKRVATVFCALLPCCHKRAAVDVDLDVVQIELLELFLKEDNKRHLAVLDKLRRYVLDELRSLRGGTSEDMVIGRLSLKKQKITIDWNKYAAISSLGLSGTPAFTPTPEEWNRARVDLAMELDRLLYLRPIRDSLFLDGFSAVSIFLHSKSVLLNNRRLMTRLAAHSQVPGFRLYLVVAQTEWEQVSGSLKAYGFDLRQASDLGSVLSTRARSSYKCLLLLNKQAELLANDKSPGNSLTAT